MTRAFLLFMTSLLHRLWRSLTAYQLLVVVIPKGRPVPPVPGTVMIGSGAHWTVELLPEQAPPVLYAPPDQRCE